MNTHNYVFIAIFLLFTLSSRTRVSALVLLFSYLMYAYFLLVVDVQGLNYYSITATIDFCAGLFFALYLKDKVMSYLMFMAVPIGIIGGLLFWRFHLPIIYANMCITVMILQVIILLWRANKRGILNIGGCIVLFVHGAFASNSKTRNIKK